MEDSVCGHVVLTPEARDEIGGDVTAMTLLPGETTREDMMMTLDDDTSLQRLMSSAEWHQHVGHSSHSGVVACTHIVGISSTL